MDGNEKYVNRETAKLLKKAGFDLRIYTGYILYEGDTGFITEFQTPHNFNGNNGQLFSNYGGHKEVVSRPTLTLTQRWLREIKNIEVQVEWCVVINGIVNSFDKRQYEYSIQGPIDMPYMCYTENGFKTYEEALEAGIQKCLNLLLNE